MSTTQNTPLGAPPAAPRGNGAGLAAALGSAASFALSGSLAGGLGATGWSPTATVAARVGLAALVLALPAAWAVRHDPRSVLRAWRTILAYGAFAVVATQLCFFIAITRLSVGTALLIEYLAPVVLVVWAWARRGVRPTAVVVGGAVIAMSGLALVLGPSGGSSIDPIGAAWAFGACLGVTVYYSMSADTTCDLPPLTLTATGLGVAAVVLVAVGVSGLVPWTASTADVDLNDVRLPAWLAVLLLALVTAAAAYVLGIVAARRLGSTLASFIGLSEVLFAVAFAWVLLGQRLTGIQVAGGAAVLAGVALVRAAESRRDVVGEPLATGDTP